MENNKGLLAMLAVVLVIGLGAYMLMSNNDDSAMESTKNNSVAETSRVEENNEKMEEDKMEEEGVMVGGAMMTPDKDIVENAMNSKDHTTVVAAVAAAGLVDTLKGPGPFTVFAPTNAAFEKLPAGTVDTLLKPENKSDLTKVLTYHVVPGAYRASDIKEGMTLKTVQGQNLTFSMKDGKWWINGASMITIADVVSSNGVTHVVDMVLLPQ